jgi:arsenate reductase (thioredoxin)
MMRSMSVSLLLGAFLLGLSGEASSQRVLTPSEPAQVVFVCEHGSVKSLVAMTFFNQRAQARGLPYRAIARGTAPEPIVPAPVRDGLRSDGFEVFAFAPRKFEASDAEYALLVVSFDQDIGKTVGAKRYVKWDDLPGVLTDYTRGRDEILRHVDELINELAGSNGP